MVDTVRTEAALAALFADNTSGLISEQDLRDFLISSRYLANQGWDFHLDSEFTSGSPRTILAGVRTQVTIDGLTETLGHPLPLQHFWDVVTNKLIPNGVNNFGIVRLAMTAQSTAAPVNFFEIELDTAAGPFSIIYQQTAPFLKGFGNPQNYNFVIPLFSGPDFQANGATFYITPDSDATFWEFAITAAQIYGAAP
jgi:hypothetical protein